MEAELVAKYAVLAPLLDERARRLWAATESLALGYGGDAIVSAATGLARASVTGNVIPGKSDRSGRRSGAPASMSAT
jgi:hypothetical protein